VLIGGLSLLATLLVSGLVYLVVSGGSGDSGSAANTTTAVVEEAEPEAEAPAGEER
jgi:hypothetical protein